MAIYHNSVSVIKRSAGKSSVAAAAYRSGKKLTDEQTGIIHDYSRKSGVDHSVILTPINADWITDRQQLWNKIEATERRGDSQLAREITVAIPRELNREDKIDLVCKYVQKNYIDLGMIADINFHGMDSDNPHAHIMVTLRDLKIDEQGVVSFGNKNRQWNHKNLLIKNREDWAVLTNKSLIAAGYPDIQIDHRSNADRGIETIPQRHLGAEAAAMRKKGIKSELGDEYDRIEIVNHNIREKLENIFESESATRNLEQQLAEFDRQVTTDIEITPPEILKAKERGRTQWFENIEIPKKVLLPPKPPEPAYSKPDKWSLKKQIDPQLVRAILQVGDEIGTDYKASGYQIQINVAKKEIEVKYQDNVVMIVYPPICQALLIDHTYTVKQYESGLRKSIDILVTNLQHQAEQAKELEPEQLKPEQLKPPEQRSQAEPEQLKPPEQQKELEPELPHDIIKDDSEIIIDNPKINVTKLLASKNLSL